MAIRRIQVKMPGQTYEIRLGRGTIAKLGIHMREIDEAKKAIVLSDEHLQQKYGIAVSRELTSVGYECHELALPASKKAKSLGYVNEIFENMALHGISKSDVIVAVGGKSVIDVATFVAATYRGGINLVLIPTSFAAMTQKMVGGDCHLDLNGGKNLVGLTKYPYYVTADINVMQSLPQEEWVDGLAEITKMCVMSSQKNFDWLKDMCEPLTQRESEVVQGSIARCVEWKANTIAEATKMKDPELLRCFDYGSTLANAIDALADDEFPRGLLVAEGMRFAARLSVEMLGVPASFVQKQDAYLDALGLEAIPFSAPAAMIYDALRLANANGRRGATKFVLPNGAGKWEEVAIPRKTLMAHLNAWVTVKEYLLEQLAEIEEAEREAEEARLALEEVHAERFKSGLEGAFGALNEEYQPIPEDEDYVPEAPQGAYSDEDFDDEAEDEDVEEAEDEEKEEKKED